MDARADWPFGNLTYLACFVWLTPPECLTFQLIIAMEVGQSRY